MLCHRFPALLSVRKDGEGRTKWSRPAGLVRIVVVKVFEPYGERYQERDKPVETYIAEIRYFAT